MRDWLGRASVALIAGLALACGGAEESTGTPPQGAATSSREPEVTPQPKPDSGSAPVDVASASDEARDIFATRCFTCHGPEGAGDGPGAAALTPKPRNFKDATWQASVSNEHIEMIIQYGGAAVGKSPTMPGNPDLMSKPAVVTALREHIRGLSSQ